MRDKAHLDNNSTKSTTERDCSGESELHDPTLRAIREVVDLQKSRKARASGPQHSSPVKADAPGRERPAPASRQALPSTSPTKWLVRIALAFLRRPDAPRLLSILFLLTLIIVRPGFVLFLFLIAVLIGLVLYFSFGPDRVESFVVTRYRRLRERDLNAAEKLRHRAAIASKILSVIADKLPESWTAGLYLPDFEEPPERPEKMTSDPFDRLTGQ